MIQYYADSDVNGKIVAFYNDDIWDVANIPTTAIPITEEEWQDCLSNPRKYKIPDAELVEKTPEEIAQEIADELAAQPTPPPTAEQRIAELETKNAALKIENEQVKSIATATSTDFMALTDYLAELGVI